jgi:prepilin-type N-terminal cleavage/methylation domain-containing protein
MDNAMTNKGFTLVETLVAISVLIVAVTGAYAAAQTGLSSSIFSKNEIVAFYLAQEGIEGIRNLRDENGIKGQNWLAGVASVAGDPCYPANGTQACKIDAITNVVSACSGGIGSCETIRQDPDTGFYGYTQAWTPTVFKRDIVLTKLSEHEVSILVRVAWNKGIVQRSFKARENILDWQSP